MKTLAGPHPPRRDPDRRLAAGGLTGALGSVLNLERIPRRLAG